MVKHYVWFTVSCVEGFCVDQKGPPAYRWPLLVALALFADKACFSDSVPPNLIQNYWLDTKLVTIVTMCLVAWPGPWTAITVIVVLIRVPAVSAVMITRYLLPGLTVIVPITPIMTILPIVIM